MKNEMFINSLWIRKNGVRLVLVSVETASQTSPSQNVPKTCKKKKNVPHFWGTGRWGRGVSVSHIPLNILKNIPKRNLDITKIQKAWIPITLQSRGPVVCASLGIRGWESVPARICSNSYFTNKNSCWSFTLLRQPSLIICIYCHTIQTSISLYKRFLTDKSTRYNLSYFIPFIFIFLILIFSIRSWIIVMSGELTIASVNWRRVWCSLIDVRLNVILLLLSVYLIINLKVNNNLHFHWGKQTVIADALFNCFHIG